MTKEEWQNEINRRPKRVALTTELNSLKAELLTLKINASLKPTMTAHELYAMLCKKLTLIILENN